MVWNQPEADLFFIVIPDLIRDPFSQLRMNRFRIKSGMTKMDEQWQVPTPKAGVA
jgi:hypothetical protein